MAPWLWWLSKSHVLSLLRDWKIVGCAILETLGVVLDISGCHFYLFLFTMSPPEKWAQVLLLSDSQNLPGNSIRSWLLLNPFSWDISHILEPLSLALFDLSLQLRELSNSTLSKIIATSSPQNVASSKWDVLKAKMHTDFKDLVWRSKNISL